MNKNVILTMAAVALFAITPCKAQKKVENKKAVLTTEVEKASYALGSQLGDNFKQQGFESLLNLDFIIAGLRETIEGTSQLDAATANDILNNFFMELQKSQSSGKIEEGKAFLAENGKRAGVTTTASGLQYEIITQGNGPKPDINSTVNTHYRGTLLNGTVFDSSYDRGEPISFPLNGVIRGWTEALQLMPVGSKWKIYLPYDLAYGERGAGQVIGPFETLVFEIELLGIE